jgi:hypothetical protein
LKHFSAPWQTLGLGCTESLVELGIQSFVNVWYDQVTRTSTGSLTLNPHLCLQFPSCRILQNPPFLASPLLSWYKYGTFPQRQVYGTFPFGAIRCQLNPYQRKLGAHTISSYSLICPILRFPPRKVCLSTQGSFWISLKSALNWLYFSRNKRRKLSIIYQLRLGFFSLSAAYLEILQVLRHNICSDLFPLDNIASVLCVSTGRSCTRSLIKSLVRLLGIQGESR